jgi:MFS family permease
MNKAKLWTKDFIGISLSNFFLFCTFYFLLVTLPVYSIENYHSSTSQAGLMTTVFLVSAIISRPFAGKWIEKSGYQQVLFTALLIFLISSFLYFFPTSMDGLLTIRFMHGVGFGMATTAAGAIVASIIPVSRRGEGMGYFIMSTNLAMVLGPFIGLTAMGQWGSNVLFSISAVCALAAFVTGLIIKVPKLLHKQATAIPKRSSFKSLFEGSAVPISLVGGFFAIIYSSILSFVSVYANQVHLSSVSSLFFVVYAVVLVASRPFTGKWFDRFGANVIIFPSIFLFALGIFVLSQTGSAAIFLTAAGLVGLGWGTIFPIFQTIALHHAVPQRKGVATATFLSIFDTGVGFGSFLVGLIVAQIGFHSFYFLGSFYVLLGAALYYILHTRRQAAKKKQPSLKAKTSKISSF